LDQVATYVHSQHESIDCGHFVEPDWYGAQRGIDCVISARGQRRPFTVVFDVAGIDDHFSNALIGDSSGNVVELMYATGMVIRPDTLLKHPCPAPVRLDVDNTYRIPRLFCSPRNHEWTRDYLLW
jgi:hypothetical protein